MRSNLGGGLTRGSRYQSGIYRGSPYRRYDSAGFSLDRLRFPSYIVGARAWQRAVRDVVASIVKAGLR